MSFPFLHHLLIESEEEPKTEELRVAQRERADDERDRADTSEAPDEQHQHERRADKAAYLAKKLAERERSERDG